MVATEHPAVDLKVVGTRPIRHDGLDKVTGRAVYGADVRLAGLIHGAYARSPHSHARILRIDTSAAERLPGVLAVMTAAEMPGAGEERPFGARMASDRLMATDKVVFRGHPVAAVAAVERNTAHEAARLIEVDYETLPPVLNIRDAMAPDAPVIHDDLVGDDLGEPVRNTNVSTHLSYELGDVDEGFAAATTVVEREVVLATVHQGYIEPHTATARWNEDGRLTVWSSSQGAFGIRAQLASALGISESRIKVIPTEIGGGFGGKLSAYVEPIAAILSRKSGRPVKIEMDRVSVFEATGPAAAAVVKFKIGVDGNGRITAAQGDLRYEAGAYPGSPVQAGAVCALAAYDIPNVRIDGYAVLVTKPRTAAYRAPGSTHVAYAVESVIDEIRELIGMDPIEFRMLNASVQGGRRADGPRWGPIGIRQVLEAARSSAHWNAPLEKEGANGRKRGRGIATGFWRNAGRRSTVQLNVNSDGTVTLVEGSVDIGGTRAAIAMQAAEVLGLPAEDVIPTVVDTDSIGYTDSTGGSRTAYATGYAAYEAARAVAAEMQKRAALIWEIDEQDVAYADGVFSSVSDPELRMSFKELASRLTGTGGPVAATGAVDVAEAGGAFSTHIVDLEVDTQTGKTEILRYTAVQDVGRAVHPSYVEGQMQGGVAQGVGWALNEEYFLDDSGRMANSSFLDYRMPTSLDLPQIETVIVEVPNPIHPYGVRGVGEVPIVPPVGAVANALHDALGVRFREAPMKPARILAALGALETG